MKKILTGVIAAAALLFGFVSCSGDLHDDTVLQMTKIIGDMNGSSEDMVVNGNVSTYTFTYDGAWNAWGGGSGTLNFKVLKVWDNWVTAGWGPDAATEVVLNGDEVTGSQGGGQGNFVLKNLVIGTEYVITATSNADKVNVKLTGPEATPADPADLSAINSTTMAQVNAHIEIKGDSGNDALVGKYYFNKVGSNYVARIPFNFAGVSLTGWNGTNYACWGKIGVGDNKTVVADEKQFNYASGSLNFDATNNIDLPTVVTNTKGVIVITASASGCTCVAEVY